MPDIINTTMKKAVYELWQASNSLAGEEVTRIRHEADIAVREAKEELAESLLEITCLESGLEEIGKEKDSIDSELTTIKKE